MKQINFNLEGGFPLEQESLERLQTAYRSELFGALKAHLSIDTNQNYIVSQATNMTKGWVIIQQDESNLNDSETVLTTTEGILYPIKEATPTGYLKTTRTGTNLVYGTGLSQTAYYDYEAEYISQTEFLSGISQDSDVLKVYYHDLGTFKVVKDLTAIEGILEAINANIDAIESNIDAIESNIDTIESNIDSVETDINVINQTYLPLDGSKAMTGDFSMSSKRLLQPTNSTGRALVNSSDTIISSLSLNYQSDWQNTSIGGKVYLENLSTTNSTGSLLVIDDYHQVTKSNSLPELLNRITVLESKISAVTAAVPIGMIAIWGKSAPFPEGWEEYVPLRGRMPVGLNITEAEFNIADKTGGSKSSSVSVAVPISDYTSSQNTSRGTAGKLIISTGAEEDSENLESIAIVSTSPNISFSLDNLNPYRVIQFIEYTGRSLVTTALTTPPNLIAQKVGATFVDLSWISTNDDGVTNYLVYKDNILYATLNNVPFSTVNGLSRSSSYNFNVRAQDAAGNISGASNTLRIKTNLL